MSESKSKANIEKEVKEEVLETVEEDLVTEEDILESAEEETGINLEEDINAWTPKTELGWKVRNGEITSLKELVGNGLRIKEEALVDFLCPDLQIDFLTIGQSKGKFGGGKRKAYRVTQKITAEGSNIKFSAMAVVSDGTGIVGLGTGSSIETVPTRNKAEKAAKLNLIDTIRGCGSWECNCSDPHSIPFAIEGKSGSVTVKVMPAPKGTGLAVNDTTKQLLGAAGIKDAWSVTKGQTVTRFNLAKATFNALKQLKEMRSR